jgi:hypothetical protein
MPEIGYMERPRGKTLCRKEVNFTISVLDEVDDFTLSKEGQ